MKELIDKYAQAYAVVYSLEGSEVAGAFLTARVKLAEAEDTLAKALSEDRHMQELRAYELTVENLRQKVHSRTILAAWSFILMAGGAAAWKFL